jgi:hypothetical protein
MGTWFRIAFGLRGEASVPPALPSMKKAQGLMNT